jgi:hypothetical protein
MVLFVRDLLEWVETWLLCIQIEMCSDGGGGGRRGGVGGRSFGEIRLRIFLHGSSLLQHFTCTIIAIITDSGRRIDEPETMIVSSTAEYKSRRCLGRMQPAPRTGM